MVVSAVCHAPMLLPWRVFILEQDGEPVPERLGADEDHGADEK